VPLRVAVLIVNWNSGGLLCRSLESVHRQQRRPDHVIVVDNASSDDSLDRAGPQLQGVELIRLPSNAGFAGANNVGARAAKGVDAIALLNPDAEAEPEWLAALTEAAEQYPRAASFASQTRFASAPQVLDGAGDSYHASGGAWRNGYSAPVASWPMVDVEVFAACAAAALYRREAFESVGGFDERYFCYFEDVDLGFRLRLRGHHCMYVHRAIVRHVGSGVAGHRSDFAIYHGQRNAVWTFVKNMPRPLAWLYLPQHLILNAVAVLYYACQGRGRVVARAKIDALRGLRPILDARRAVQSERVVGADCLRGVLNRGLLRPYTRAYSTRRFTSA
jgi:GT2 family glycosyltransferase